MDFNGELSFNLSDALLISGNDFDDEDLHHEELNRNEIVQLIIAAFKDQEELSYEDDESINTSGSSHQTSSDESKSIEIPSMGIIVSDKPRLRIHRKDSEVPSIPTVDNHQHEEVPSTTPVIDNESISNPSSMSPVSSDDTPHQVKHHLSNSFPVEDETESEEKSLKRKYFLDNCQTNATSQQLTDTPTDSLKKTVQMETTDEDRLDQSMRNSVDHLQMKRQVIRLTEDKDQLEQTCQELQLQIRTLRDRLEKTENDLFHVRQVSSTVKTFDDPKSEEIQHLKQRVDEYAINEKRLVALTNDLQRKVQEYEQQSRRSGSSSSSSSSETVITVNSHAERIQSLTREIDKWKKDYADLEEKYDYEKHELQAMLEQLREDIIELEKNKTNPRNSMQSIEGNSVEEKLQTQFEFELKARLDEMHRILEKDYQENLLRYQTNENNLKEEIQRLENKSQEDPEEQSRAFQQEVEQIKINYEKHIQHLNNQIDRLKSNDDANDRLIYIEKEFEHLKHDYSDINRQYKDLLNIRSNVENENRILSETIDRLQEEKQRMKEEFFDQQGKLLEEIKQLGELNENQKQEILTVRRHDPLRDQIESLEIQVKSYQSTIEQYDDYRMKIEMNFQKLIQQRDKYKNECKSMKEILTKKDEQNLPTSDNDKIQYLEREKRRLEKRLEEMDQALNLADSHLQKEIAKIKSSLEQEYQRRYERDLQKMQNEQDKHRQRASPHFQNETEEMKKIYRNEIDRLYRENVELSQHQTKLIDAHHKQLELMKKDLDEGYHQIIEEFQREQTRLQTRYDQLKQQFLDAQQTIEQLKTNWNHFKTNTRTHHSTDNRHQVEHLMKLLDQSNEMLKQERMSHTRKENDYQQTIASLQAKIAEMIKHHTVAMNGIYQDHPPNRKQNGIVRSRNPSEFNQQTNSSKVDFPATSMDTVRVAMAFHLDQLDVSLKNQIHTDLIQCRNTMIKDIRRELFQILLETLRSQAISDPVIDIHLVEFDRLLTEIIETWSDTFPLSSRSAVVSVQISSSPHPQEHSPSPSPEKSPLPWKKSVVTHHPLPSNIHLTTNSSSVQVTPRKLYSNDENLVVTVEHQPVDRMENFYDDMDEITLTLDENHQSHIRILTREFDSTFHPSKCDEFSSTHFYPSQESTTYPNALELNNGRQKLVRNACQLYITPTVTINS